MRGFLCLSIMLINVCFADCLFRVSNQSLYPVKVRVGFYNAESTDFLVSNQMVKAVNVKSANNCYSTSLSGMGLAYITLIGGRSSGGWVFSPQSNMIRAVGPSHKSQDSVIGSEINGKKISLISNYKPESDTFSVMLMPAQFRDSKTGAWN